MFHFSPILWALFVIGFVGSRVPRWSQRLALLDGILKKQRVAQQQLRAGSPDEIAALKPEFLDKATQELEALGFVQAGQFLTRSRAQPEPRRVQLAPPIAEPHGPKNLAVERFKPEGFVRIFTHPTHDCMAKILFVVVNDGFKGRISNVTAMTAIVSYAGTGADDWSYSTSNNQMKPTAQAISKLWRHPHRLWTRLPDADAAQLLQKHLERRAQIAGAAGIAWKQAPTLEDDLAAEARTMERIRSTARQLSPLSMQWKMWRFKREGPTPEWLGELKGQLK